MGAHKARLDVAMKRLVETNDSVADIMSELYTSMRAIMEQAAAASRGGWEGLRARYWSYLGFIPPSPPPSPPPPSPPPPPPSPEQSASSSGVSNSVLAAAVAVPVSVVAVVAAVCWVAWVYHKRSAAHMTLTGRVKAPGVGPDTTLLITDIQDSTVLWETQSQAVMDVVIKLHHHAIREQLLKHHGYESTTEGDSFILAFHTARDAALFSVDAQEALLRAAWPPEVLAVPMCATTYAVPLVSWDTKALLAGQVGLGRGGGGGGGGGGSSVDGCLDCCGWAMGWAVVACVWREQAKPHCAWSELHIIVAQCGMWHRCCLARAGAGVVPARHRR
jgi:hypothetical protein